MTNFIVPSGITDIRPIRDIVYDHLREALIDGIIKPGERIVERTYAEKFNVSRTPIREVLRKLEMEGFVEYIPRRGIVAKGLNEVEIEEIYAIRISLERLALSMAVTKINRVQLSKVKKVHERTVMANEINDVETVVTQMRKFDDLLFEAANMPRLQKMIAGLQESLRSYRKINLSGDNRRHLAIAEHGEILQAVINKDVDLAEKLVVEHIERARNSLLGR